jgi:hypothetical protein
LWIIVFFAKDWKNLVNHKKILKIAFSALKKSFMLGDSAEFDRVASQGAHRQLQESDHSLMKMFAIFSISS